MADAHGSGPCVRKDVGVQLPPRPLDARRRMPAESAGSASPRILWGPSPHTPCRRGCPPPDPPLVLRFARTSLWLGSAGSWVLLGSAWGLLAHLGPGWFCGWGGFWVGCCVGLALVISRCVCCLLFCGRVGWGRGCAGWSVSPPELLAYRRIC